MSSPQTTESISPSGSMSIQPINSSMGSTVTDRWFSESGAHHVPEKCEAGIRLSEQAPWSYSYRHLPSRSAVEIHPPGEQSGEILPILGLNGVTPVGVLET